MAGDLRWFVVQLANKEEGQKVELPKCTLLELKTCTSLWKTNHVIRDELEVRGYLNCMLIHCTESSMQTLTADGGPLKRRRAQGMGPYDCIELTDPQVSQLVMLLHVTDRYSVYRTAIFQEEKPQGETKLLEVMRGTLRGLKGDVICDRANMRKFTPIETLPGLQFMILMPAADLKPLTKVEYESLKLKADTNAKWYLVLAKNERHLQHAFKLSVRGRVQEGIFTEELGLDEYQVDMPLPEGISRKRYFFHPGKPFPIHYYFVFTTLGDMQSFRSRNPYARVSVVWSRKYEPVSLRDKDFEQLVNSVTGRQQELTDYMKKFIEGLKTGDEVGVFLTNLQELPFPVKVVQKKGKKLKVQDDRGVTLTVREDQIKPLKKR